MKPSASTVFASSISSTRLRLYTALRASFCKAKCTLNVVVVRRVVECPENFRHLLPLAKTVAALASAELVHRVSGAACSCCLEWKLGMPAPMAAAAPLRMSSSPSDTNSPIFGGEVDAAYCLTFWRGRSLVTRVTTLVVHSRHAVLCGETELLPGTGILYCVQYRYRYRSRTGRNNFTQSVSQLFHGPAPRSPLHRLATLLGSQCAHNRSAAIYPRARAITHCGPGMRPAWTRYRVT